VINGVGVASPFLSILYLPVGFWVGTGVGLVIAFRRSAPSVVLRLAATFLALWALLATTTLVWVLNYGGWGAVMALVRSPLMIFEPRYAMIWVGGTVGAFVVFAIAFSLNQMVAHGFLRLWAQRALPWPSRLPRPTEPTSLFAFVSDRLEAFSFTILGWDRAERRFRRREVVLLSEPLLAQLDPLELEATIAHELSHIRGLDSRYLTFLRTLSRLMRWDPVLAYLAFSLTRREEYRADSEAAELTGNPMALARALYKASTVSGPEVPFGSVGFLGAGGKRGRRQAIERIRRLMELAESGRFREGPGA
jgi:Zn-dependent protease with chaperone function